VDAHSPPLAWQRTGVQLAHNATPALREVRQANLGVLSLVCGAKHKQFAWRSISGGLVFVLLKPEAAVEMTGSLGLLSARVTGPERDDMNWPPRRLLDCPHHQRASRPSTPHTSGDCEPANMKTTISRTRQPHAAGERIGRVSYAPCSPALDIRNQVFLPDRVPRHRLPEE
jgi:hypothetical protein